MNRFNTRLSCKVIIITCSDFTGRGEKYPLVYKITPESGNLSAKNFWWCLLWVSVQKKPDSPKGVSMWDIAVTWSSGHAQNVVSAVR